MASNSSILKTLIYSDIFDFPLTKEELWRFLIAKNVDRASFEKTLTKYLPVKWERKGGFYFLPGREEIVEKRIERKKESREKIKFAKKIIGKLSTIPTVLLIGISGGLALENAKDKDDIDLFVITRVNTLWITRLLLVLLLVVMGQYRGRGKKESQKICLNMLISEKALTFEKDRQNLYTAHEIVQLKPIFNRNNMYKKFITANHWVKKFLPNAVGRIPTSLKLRGASTNYELRIKEIEKPLFIIHYSLFILNKFAKVLQLLYMKKHRTVETISDQMLAFHPFEYKNYVLEEYNRRLRKYEI